MDVPEEVLLAHPPEIAHGFHHNHEEEAAVKGT